MGDGEGLCALHTRESCAFLKTGQEERSAVLSVVRDVVGIIFPGSRKALWISGSLCWSCNLISPLCGISYVTSPNQQLPGVTRSNCLKCVAQIAKLEPAQWPANSGKDGGTHRMVGLGHIFPFLIKIHLESPSSNL